MMYENIYKSGSKIDLNVWKLCFLETPKVFDTVLIHVFVNKLLVLLNVNYVVVWLNNIHNYSLKKNEKNKKLTNVSLVLK